jgi:hypothetical protein
MEPSELTSKLALEMLAKRHKHEEPIPESEFIAFTIISVLLVVMAGLMSGLTIGLMALDVIDLEVMPTLCHVNCPEATANISRLHLYGPRIFNEV